MFDFLRRVDVQAIVLVGAITLVVALTYWGFRAPYNIYLPILHLARNPDAFPLDSILANSVYFKASIYYSLVSFLNLTVENDLIGVVFHFILNGGVLFLLFRQARRSFGLTETFDAAVFVLVACFFYSKFTLGTMAQPIAFNILTPTGLAQVAGFAGLLLVLEKRYVLAALLFTLCIALAPKGNILIAPAFVLFVLADRTVPKRAYVYALLPFAFIAYRMLDPAIAGVSHETAVQLTTMAILRDKSDALFYYQPALANVFLGAAFVIFPFLIRKFNDHSLVILGWSLYAVTLGAVAVNVIYPLVYEKFPVPVFVMLSIPQATKYFLFVFSAMTIAWVLNERRFLWHEKLTALLAFVLLKPFPTQALLAGTLILAGIAAPRLFAKISGTSFGLERIAQRLATIPLPVATAVLLSGFVLLRSGTSYVGPSWIDTIAFRHVGTWSASVWADDETWKAWKALAGKKEDFPLLAVYKPLPAPRAATAPNKYYTHPFAYTVSGKSQFAPLPAHTYLNLELWQEAQSRREIRDIIFDRLVDGIPIDDTWVGKVTIRKEKIPISINDTIAGFLRKRQVRVLVPAELVSLFPTDTGRERIGTHILISFDR